MYTYTNYKPICRKVSRQESRHEKFPLEPPGSHGKAIVVVTYFHPDGRNPITSWITNQNHRRHDDDDDDDDDETMMIMLIKMMITLKKKSSQVLHQMSRTFVAGAIQEFQVARANLWYFWGFSNHKMANDLFLANL